MILTKFYKVFRFLTDSIIAPDEDSCSSYDSISTTDLTVGTTNTVTDTATVIDTSSCNPDDAFY